MALPAKDGTVNVPGKDGIKFHLDPGRPIEALLIEKVHGFSAISARQALRKITVLLIVLFRSKGSAVRAETGGVCNTRHSASDRKEVAFEAAAAYTFY